MSCALEDQWGVNLIRKHPRGVCEAQVGDLLKHRSWHYLTGRVVRICQHEDAYAACQRCLQRFKIDCAGSIQRELDKLDSRLWQLCEKGRVRRGEEGHLLAWLGENPTQLDESSHDVGHEGDLFRVDRPIQPTSREAGERGSQAGGRSAACSQGRDGRPPRAGPQLSQAPTESPSRRPSTARRLAGGQTTSHYAACAAWPGPAREDQRRRRTKDLHTLPALPANVVVLAVDQCFLLR